MVNTKGFLKSKIRFIFITIYLIFQANITFALNNFFNHSWATSEHIQTGNQLDLYYCDKSDKQCNFQTSLVMQAEVSPLELDNGLKLTFGEIVAFAGDYFAIADQPITGGLYDNIIDISENDYSNPVEIPKIAQLELLAENFKDAFITLSAGWQAEQIINLIYKYLSGDLTLEEAMQLGLQRYDMAVNNFDHFTPYSWHAYAVGHKIALDFAAKAGKNNSQQDLNYAYAIEAFAQHFLTDTFAAGHIRVPIKALRRFVFLEKNALLLTKFMHDEDTKFGLYLHNINGDSWHAYGDSYYNDDRNRQNKIQLQKAQQLGIDQIYHAYLNSEDKINYQQFFKELQLIMPILNSHTNNLYVQQNYPLFTSDQYDNIYMRENINKLQDSNTKTLSQFGALWFLIQKLYEYDPS